MQPSWEIREVRDVPNRWKNRTGASGDFVYRLNWDPHRRRKDRALVIYLREKRKAESRLSGRPENQARRSSPS